MNQLQDLINGALKGEDNIRRAQSQNALIGLRQGNTSEFLITCSQLMNDDSKNNFIRQSAGAILGRSAITKNSNGTYYWDFLNNNGKNEIRENVINTLVNPEHLIVNSGASTLSQIASIQISRGQWLDLIDIFAQNVQHVEFQVRQASILSIGYICEQLKNINATLNQKSCQQLLGSIIVGSREKKSPIIVQTAHKALRNSISFLDPILQHKQIRDQAIKIIMESISNQQYSRQLYQSLFEFVKTCYPFLGDYMSKFLQVSNDHLGERGELTRLCLQLWDTIGTEYFERLQQSKIRIKQMDQNYNIVIPNYLDAVVNQLLNNIMQCVVIMSQEQRDDCELRESAIKTLSTFVEACDKKIIELITSAVSCIINSSDIGQRQASALIFSTLSDFKDKQMVLNVFKNGFEHLFALLSDDNEIVVMSTLKGFSKLFETFPEVVTMHINNKDIIKTFFSLMDNKNKEICLLTLSCLNFISEGLTKDKRSLLAADLEFMFVGIVAYYQRNFINFHHNFKEANERTILVILNLIMATTRKDILQNLITFSIEKYYLVTSNNINDHAILVAGIISLMHTSLLCIRGSINQITLMNTICNLLDAHLQMYGVQQQGLSLISALTLTFNKRFQSKLNQYWKYIIIGIQMTNEVLVFKAALAVVGDCSRIYQNTFVQKGQTILERLFLYIRNNIGLQQKIAILACIGDLLLSMKEQGSRCLDHCLQITNECCFAVYELQKDPNMLDCVEELKQSLIEMYTCIVFALNNGKHSNQKLIEHFPKIAEFVVNSCDPSLNPTVSYLKNCLFLIFDSAIFYYTTNSSRMPFLNNVVGSQPIQRLVKIIMGIKDHNQIAQLMNLISSWKTRQQNR